ncbi:DUF2510 domain-containing protein [Tessaracoccus sp. Y36]
MGLFRKAVSLSTLGVVSYRSKDERVLRAAKQTAKYSKQARNAARAQVVQGGVGLDLQRQQLQTAEYQAGVSQAQLEQGEELLSRRPVQRQVVTRGALHAPQRAVPQAPPSIPAGWYPDPYDKAMLTWWDGTRWLTETRRSNAPLPSGPAADGTPPADS